MMLLFFILAGCLVLDIVLSMVFVGVFWFRHDTVLLGIGTGLTFLYAVEIVVMCFFWYRAWRSIQDGHARTTPGKAVGLMFIPLFNLYWAFVLLAGFARDYNSFCRRHNIGTPPRHLPEGYFLTVVILWLLAVVLRWLPVVGGAVNAVITPPRALMMFIGYSPAIGAIYNIIFLLAMLVLLYQTARAVTAVQGYDATGSSQTTESIVTTE
jgi:hypothetical protein